MIKGSAALSLLLAAVAAPASAQPRPAQPAATQPYVADGKLGELYLLGGTLATKEGKFVDETEQLLVSVDTARLALRFPTRDKLVIAGESQQLLILSGAIRNPQKRDLDLSGGSLLTIRFFGNARAFAPLYGQETTIQPDTRNTLKLTLKPGESARYSMALRVPAEQPSLRIGTLRRLAASRRYDFETVVTGDPSVFPRIGASVASSAKAGAGQTFDLDGFDMTVSAVREVPKVGAYTASAGKHLYAAEVQVTNRMLLPQAWGWQYLTPELEDAAGNPIPWSRDALDAATGQTWSRELNAGETATIVYVFSAGARTTPATLRLLMTKSKRQVDVALR